MYISFYYGTGVLLLLILINLCRWRPTDGHQRQPVGSTTLFLSVVVLTLAVMRTPSIGYNQELNVDESQVISSGITLLEDPVYGRSVDGTTIGPLNSYALLLPHLLGLPMDYSSARLLALLLIISSVLIFHRSLLLLISPVASRICTMFVTLLFAWTADDSFLHFSSELTSVWLLNACFYLSVRVIQAPQPSSARVFAIGLLAGLAPYGKLQAVPILGAVLFVLSVYLIYTYRIKSIGLLALGGLGFMLPTGLVFGVAYVYDVSDYYVNFYFLSNLLIYRQLYADVPLVHGDFLLKLLSFPHFAWHHTDFFVFVILPFIAAGSSIRLLNRRFAGLHQWPGGGIWPVLLTGLTSIVATWAVVVPGTEFGHHLLLLVFPVGWVTGWWLHRLLTRSASSLTPTRLPVLLLAFCTGSLLLSNTIVRVCFNRLLIRLPATAGLADQTDAAAGKDVWLYPANPALFAFPNHTRIVLSPVARIVTQYAVPTDRLAVWGWHCSYYVETQLVQGVSEAHTQRSVLPNPMQAMYLSRYARELAKNRPVVFLDAVGKNSLTLVRSTQRSEHFREVQAIIRDEYQFVGNVDDVRIFVRNDHAAQRLFSSRLTLLSRPRDGQALFRPAVTAIGKKPPTHLSGLEAINLSVHE